MKAGTIYRQCKKFGQVMACLASLSISIASGAASEEKVLVHDAFTEFGWENPRYVMLYDVDNSQEINIKETKKKKVSRGPASLIPRDDMEALPAVQDEVWLSNVFVEDRAGVMNNMVQTFSEWERMEEYRQNWDIGSTGLYNTPDMEQKRAWFNRMILRYAEKRFTGELKNAEAGSTLKKIETAQKALRPDTSASITKNFKIKFRAKVLRMQGQMLLINPWVESETIFRADGRINTRVSKTFEDLGVRTDFNYQVKEGFWEARMAKPLTQTVQAVISSRKIEQIDNTVQLIYNTRF